MIDLNDKQELEHHFAGDFKTNLFPVLADIYYKEKDYQRARKVCQIGVKHNPDSVDGKYIFAKIELLENNIQQAEQHLKFVVSNHQAHINAMRLLFEIQTSLKRSPKTILQTVTKILRIYPDDENSQKWVKENESKLEAEPQKIITEKPKSESPSSSSKSKIPRTKELEPSQTPKSKKVKKSKISDGKPINKRFATLTLAKIFKSQGSYYQAMEIITSIKLTDDNKKQIEKERKEIEKLLSSQTE
ncbi:MAG: hypothetical protein ISR90_00445 [Candidatus Marinimicrobia bacterium]|nr:hypothetical protein [Candidatus Neomarinimicrobiota bacterium]MBL7022511.1 hypothetical protein [Candidatus Neomarinimicrobiota bacterium]MBL7108634.1 hypothetical protein [Candidatus Neomarinimicrobiota bacterium]